MKGEKALSDRLVQMSRCVALDGTKQDLVKSDSSGGGVECCDLRFTVCVQFIGERRITGGFRLLSSIPPADGHAQQAKEDGGGDVQGRYGEQQGVGHSVSTLVKRCDMFKQSWNLQRQLL